MRPWRSLADRMKEIEKQRIAMLTDETVIAEVRTREIMENLKRCSRVSRNYCSRRTPQELYPVREAMRALAKENRIADQIQKYNRNVFFYAIRYTSVAPAVVIAGRAGLPADQVRAVLTLFDK